MDKKIDKHVLELLSIIEEDGYKAYVVGGAIRDIQLGITPDDYDICTNMPINVIEKKFSNMIVEENGKSFLSIKIKYKKRIYEITNTRIEDEYLKPGYPSKTKLTPSIHEDLKRRDFTINALAYSPSDGLIDDYNSIGDIQQKIIRTIGNPYKRFTEDPSRILRCIRFAATLNFSIEEETLKAMMHIAPDIKKLSLSKIKKEFYKILSIPDISLAIDLLDKINFFELIFNLKSELGDSVYNENLNNLKLSTNQVDSRLLILFRLSSFNI